jgi:prepilin signal peptidase PulO-like enzyme (type II secretory pathway)
LPVVLIAVALAALAASRHRLGADAAIPAFLAGTLVVVASTDLERRIIPNRIVLPATAIVLITNLAFHSDRSLEFILGGLLGSAVFLVPNLVNGSWVGMGDVKLGLLLGAGLGWGAVGAIAVASISVFPVALAIVVRGGSSTRKATLPFGPFLAIGGVVMLIAPRLIGLGGG